MSKTNYDVIVSPVITEKATKLTEANQVVFRVTLDATKPQIAKAVADLFKVKVKAVNTITTKGKNKNFHMSARNLSHVSLLPASGINVYDIMRSEKLVLTKAALQAIEERFA